MIMEVNDATTGNELKTSTTSSSTSTTLNKKQCSSILNSTSGPGPTTTTTTTVGESISMTTTTTTTATTTKKPRMLPNLPPHHNIRADDTQEIENATTNYDHSIGGSGKSSSKRSSSGVGGGSGFYSGTTSATGSNKDSHHHSNSNSNKNPNNSNNNSNNMDDDINQIKLPLYQRLVTYLHIKSRLLSYSLYLLLIFLSIAILIAIALLLYYLLTIYYHKKIIPIKTRSCISMKVTLCQKFNVHYSKTKLPNKFGQLDQQVINEKLTTTYSTILGIKCYTLLPLFLCSQLVPRCNSTGYSVPMCKQLCKESKHRCDFFLDIFDIEWPDEIDCETLPDSNDPDICVGNQQALELNQLANRHICKENGFRCDQTRCIPPNWQCDGYMDCIDYMDERNCNECLDDQFYCSNGVCIDRINICDGKPDCPDGRDERQCFRLSDSMGSNGWGKLQVWNPITGKWDEVCGEDWKVPEQSEQVCQLLGYQYSNETRIQDETNSINPDQNPNGGYSNSFNRNNYFLQRYFNNNHQQPSSSSGAPPATTTKRMHFANILKGRLNNNENNKCKDSNTSVHIRCLNFQCGRPSASLERGRRRNIRIVGGEESYPGKWPWLVSFHGGPAEVFFCAGVLISEWWVLTAAHCIGTKSNTTGWTVSLGVTRRTSSPLFVRQRQVAKLIKHPGFQMSVDFYYSDDIALVLLKEKVEYDEFLRPVCLPANSSVEVEPGTKCMVIGWGKKIHDDYADYQSAIHEVEVPIVSHRKCIKWYAKQLPYHPIPNTMVCAGYEQGQKDACQGDSGGPLLCKNDDDQSWFVAGIVSWGINCAQPQLPGIYTNVPKYLNWIKMTTFDNNKPISNVNANLDYEIP